MTLLSPDWDDPHSVPQKHTLNKAKMEICATHGSFIVEVAHQEEHGNTEIVNPKKYEILYCCFFNFNNEI